MKFLSALLKSVWLFFPSILFILLTFTCFISLSQGKDILISFTENTRTGHGLRAEIINLLIKLSFFIAIAFWVYVSWYSSRMVAYAKMYRQQVYAKQFRPTLTEEELDKHFEIQQHFLDLFPRLVGYGCFIIVLFAIANLLFTKTWISSQPIIWLAICIIIVWIIDEKLIRFTNTESGSKRLSYCFSITGILFLILIPVLSFTALLNKIPVLFGMTFLLMLLFMLYINLRRKWVEQDHSSKAGRGIFSSGFVQRKLYNLMRFMRLKENEYGYFLWFNIICTVGFVVYLMAIFSFKTAITLGPMPLVMLAFAVLLGFGNFLTALSVKWSINLHFIIFLFAAIVKTPETHFVRTAKLQERHIDKDIFKKRLGIQDYFINWINNHPAIDSSKEYPLYFVLGNGGASRSAYWVTSVLGRLEDQSIQLNKERFSDHIFCLSGTSGGGVGVASFYNMIKYASKQDTTRAFTKSASSFLSQDFLSFTLARMLGPDYFNYIPGINLLVTKNDRVYALESAFENATDTAHYKLLFNSTYFDECIALPNQINWPILCINTTRVQDGSPAVLCSIHLDSLLFNKRIDVLNLLNANTSIRLSTAAILGARFPYISPAGRIDQLTGNGIQKNYFVDGGYFDNSGAGIVQEMIRAILKVADSCGNPVLLSRMKKLKIVVLHITNSPQIDTVLAPVTPFKNDLTSPLLTILGAYDMQTTVNDMRLAAFTQDINQPRGISVINKASYYPIHLYNDPQEAGDSLSNGPYAMNWFISDTVRRQMDRRLMSQPKLQRLLATLKQGQ